MFLMQRRLIVFKPLFLERLISSTAFRFWVLLSAVVCLAPTVAQAQQAELAPQRDGLGTVPPALSAVHEWLDELQLVENFEDLKFAWVRDSSSADMGLPTGVNRIEFYRVLKPLPTGSEPRIESFSLALHRSISEGELRASAFEDSKNQISLQEAVYVFRRGLPQRFPDRKKLIPAEAIRSAVLECCVLTWLTQNAKQPHLTSQILSSVNKTLPRFFKQISLPAVKSHFEEVRMREIHAALSNPLIAWTDLAVELRQFDQLFPGSAYGDRSAYLRGKLERLYRVQEAHPQLEFDELSQLPQPDRIAELITQLQYQGGTMMSSFQSYADPLVIERSPATQLRDIGKPAVPALIKAIDDERFTRIPTIPSLQFFRVLTVGECCLLILSDIAIGEDFDEFVFNSPPSSMKTDLRLGKAAAERWWRELNSTSELDYLTTKLETLRDEWEIFDLAEHLLSQYPDSALEHLEPIVEKFNLIAPFVLEKIAATKPAGFEGYLKRQTASRRLSTRVAANKELWKLGDEAALARMLKDWQRATKDPAAMQRLRERENNAVLSMIVFLLNEGDAEVFECLERTLPRLDAYTVYLALANLPSERLSQTLQPAAEKQPVAPVVAASTAAFRRLLLCGLSDNRISNPRASTDDPRQIARLSDITASRIWYKLDEQSRPEMPLFEYVPTQEEIDNARNHFNNEIRTIIE